MGDELGIGFEGDDFERLFEIEIGVFALMRTDVEYQVGLACHLRRLPKWLWNPEGGGRGSMEGRC
jgi:hypothetical protein